MKYPEEYADFTLEQEKSFINEEFRDPNRIMIVCLVEGRYTKGQLDKTYRYIAFDVETPNRNNNRISTIGISVIENGSITESFFSYVNLETHFDYFNTRLTGIDENTVADSPTFPIAVSEGRSRREEIYQDV